MRAIIQCQARFSYRLPVFNLTHSSHTHKPSNAVQQLLIGYLSMEQRPKPKHTHTFKPKRIGRTLSCLCVALLRVHADVRSFLAGTPRLNGRRSLVAHFGLHLHCYGVQLIVINAMRKRMRCETFSTPHRHRRRCANMFHYTCDADGAECALRHARMFARLMFKHTHTHNYIANYLAIM